MSREGVMVAARERARRVQAMLGEGAPVLMGCAVAVLIEPRHVVVAATPATAANLPVGDAGVRSDAALPLVADSVR